MEIFLDFCKSGHIDEREILKIRMADGQYCLPYYVVTRVLLRRNRRYYCGEQSYITNLFQCVPEDDDNPCHFVRLAILRWLDDHLGKKGPNGIPGYHPAAKLTEALACLGVTESAVMREIHALLRVHCVMAEHLRVDTVSPDDLVRLGPAGLIHLRLVAEPEYAAACSEDIWFGDEKAAQRVAARIGNRDEHYSRSTALKNAETIKDYLGGRAAALGAHMERFLESPASDLFALGELDDAVTRALERQTAKDPWFSIDQEFPVGSLLSGHVTAVKEFGVFVRLKEGVDGLLHANRLSEAGYSRDQWPKAGTEIRVRVKRRDVIRQRVELAAAARP